MPPAGRGVSRDASAGGDVVGQKARRRSGNLWARQGLVAFAGGIVLAAQLVYTAHVVAGCRAPERGRICVVCLLGPGLVGAPLQSTVLPGRGPRPRSVPERRARVSARPRLSSPYRSRDSPKRENTQERTFHCCYESVVGL